MSTSSPLVVPPTPAKLPEEAKAVEVIGLQDPPSIPSSEETSISFVQAAPGVDVFAGDVKKELKSDPPMLSSQEDVGSQLDEHLSESRLISSISKS